MADADPETRRLGWFVFSIVSFIFFMLPLSTYSIFKQELQLNIIILALILFASSIILAFFSFLFLLRAPAIISRFLEISLMLVALNLAYNFYVGDYGGKVMGADADVFDHNYKSYEIGLFVLVFFVFMLGYKKLKFYFPSIAILLILSAFGNFPPLFYGSDENNTDTSESPLMNPNFLDFSTKKNVIHIILDGMQGTHFSRMLASDASIREKFPGFTFYPDALTSSEVTYLSFSSVFSGAAWDGNGSIERYRTESGLVAGPEKTILETQSFLEKLWKNQFSIQILVAPGSSVEKRDFYDEYFHTDVLIQEEVESASFQKLFDLTLIKVAPWHIKRLVYSDGDWLFSESSVDQLPRAGRVFRFLEQYSKYITATNSHSTYKLFHFISPHAPWTTGPDCSPVEAAKNIDAIYTQARCTILSLGFLLDGLRRIDIYDHSMIVIHGDHGICDARGLPARNRENLNIPECVGNSNPLVMIKPPFDGNAFRIGTNLIELTDIAPTILDQFSIQHDYPGISVYDVHRPRSRTRYFYKYLPNRTLAFKQDKIDEVIRYAVNGPIIESGSWCKLISDKCANEH